MSTLIRNTTTLECGIDRRVDREGHGEHGGWSLSQGSSVICFCGRRMFELADLKPAPAPQAARPGRPRRVRMPWRRAVAPSRDRQPGG